MKKIKVGIIGGAGYTAGELTRLLINHPHTELTYSLSESSAGKPIHSVHHDLVGELDMPFSKGMEGDADVVFICRGHGQSRSFLENNPLPSNVKIIDLSQDFRLTADGNDFVYGLPEMNRSAIVSATKVANPGCFATCIQLGLLPAFAAGLPKGDVHISGITGSTGAGQGFSTTSHFSWRANNMSVYKALDHQHLLEIGQSVKLLMPSYANTLNFIPYRGNFTRGIITTAYFDTELSTTDLRSLYKDYYLGAAFTFVVDENPDLKLVVNTNKCLMYPQVINGKAVIISVIDNLLKGASGQALQNMNLMFGIDEKAGLNLKSIGY